MKPGIQMYFGTEIMWLFPEPNFALSLLNKISEEDMSNKKVRTAEMRFLRGHMHFIQKVIFKMVPICRRSICLLKIFQAFQMLHIQMMSYGKK